MGNYYSHIIVDLFFYNLFKNVNSMNTSIYGHLIKFVHNNAPVICNKFSSLDIFFDGLSAQN